MASLLYYRADWIRHVLYVHRCVYTYVEKVDVLYAGKTQISLDRALIYGLTPQPHWHPAAQRRLTICA
jgi:hypothetical protein